MANKYYDEREKHNPEQDVPAGDDGEIPMSPSQGDDRLGAFAEDAENEGGAADSPREATRRRTRRKSTRSQQTADESEFDPDAGDNTESGSELVELAEKGFTADEAIRLSHVSQRAAMSREAQEAEETLRRLRFTRWLIEHGMLDEFSA
jgi:hypothetical protein